MKKEVKSQAALEFLTTYAWAFIVILIAIGALYYFGVFDFSKFMPQKCLFPSQFECLDSTFIGTPTNTIQFKLTNSIGEKIRITDLDITNDAESSLSCGGVGQSPPFEWEEAIEYDFNFTSCQNGAFIIGERTEAKVSIKYCAVATTGCASPCNPPVCPEHTINGKITAVVNPP